MVPRSCEQPRGNQLTLFLAHSSLESFEVASTGALRGPLACRLSYCQNQAGPQGRRATCHDAVIRVGLSEVFVLQVRLRNLFASVMRKLRTYVPRCQIRRSGRCEDREDRDLDGRKIGQQLHARACTYRDV